MGPRRSGDRGGMTKLLHLSMKAATFAARTCAQLVEAALDRVRGGTPSDKARWTPAAPPPPRGRPVTSRRPRAPRPPRTDDGAPVAAPVTPSPAPEPPVEPELGVVPEEPSVAESPVAAVPVEPSLAESPVAAVPEEPPVAAIPEPTPGQAARIRAQRRE